METVSRLYDKVVLELDKHINYPKWEYGIYPSAESVTAAVEKGVQYMCVSENSVVGAFILNDDPQGDYSAGCWKSDLNDGEYLVIHTLATDPELCGHGIASYMVKYCIDLAKDKGYKAIRLDVVPDNVPARRLYEKLGFVSAGERDLKRDIEDIPFFALYELEIG